MATTITEATVLSHTSVRIRRGLQVRSTEILQRAKPQSDAGRAQGLWSEETIRKLTAVFELQRVQLHSELRDHQIHNGLIADIIEGLTARSYFHDPRSDDLLYEMDAHLRLLAAALRRYKYHRKSLNDDSHKAIYDGINMLSSVSKNNKDRRPANQRVEDENVAFLLKHYQFLLVSINSSQSLTRELSRRAILGIDVALAGFGSQYHEIRPRVAEIIKRQRSRPPWHEVYMQLEDACWSVFASDIRMCSMDRDINIDHFKDEACLMTFLLKDCLETQLKQSRKTSKVRTFLRHSMGHATDLIQGSGPFEEHGQYLSFGILDLLYQLSSRIRKRAREKCFPDFLKIIRMVLEHSPGGSLQLHLKATDLWNRVLLLNEKDNQLYGDEEDRRTIDKWVKQYHEMGAEVYSFSQS